MENLTVYDIFREKKRIGKRHDGGYVINILPGEYDTFISGGISNDISFEEHLLDMCPDLRCHAFDGTIWSLPKFNQRITFHKKNLGRNEGPGITNLNSHFQNYENVFLKIDIEGHEFRLLPSLFENDHMKRIKQMVIEIHSPADIHLYPKYFQGLQDIDNIFMFDCLKRINETHVLTHFHANNGCKITEIEGIKIPHVFELTYVRKDFVENMEKNTLTLPTNIDMKNIPSKEDYFFDFPPYCNK